MERAVGRPELVAWYQSREEEVRELAFGVGIRYALSVRLERLPSALSVLKNLLTDETVLCLFNVDALRFGLLLRCLDRIKVPVLLARDATTVGDCGALVIPVGYEKESKEAVVWANFLQRRSPGMTIELSVPQERDEGIAQLVGENARFIANVLEKSGAAYSVSVYAGSYERALRAAFSERRNALVCVMKTYRLFPFFVPLNIRLYRRLAQGPALLISRDDNLYVPCH